MFQIIAHVKPTENSKHFDKYKGAYAVLFINYKDIDGAFELANYYIKDDDDWDIIELEQEYFIIEDKEGMDEKFIVNTVNAGDNKVLRDLGVNNSSVFLANCSIWIEGVSDRLLVKAFLISYCKSNELIIPKEDIDFAFFEYAGSNFTHYDFNKTKADTNEAIDLITSFALNNRILLISDFDSGKETKHKNIKEIAEETNGFDYYTTYPYREIENLLDNSIWKKILINFCNQKKVTENRHNIQLRIEQSLSQIKIDNYKNEYIGCFLRDLRISELNKIYQIDNNEKPGTFIQKTELSQLILAKVRADEITWNDFSKNSTIVNLTQVIYDFIEKSKV